MPTFGCSYGEETITETNLLAIRRRHPELVRVVTFSKPRESKNGADWEWHIVGRRLTLKMRVQAKRLQRNGLLKIRHKVKLSGRQQRALLISGARASGMKPVYCIYCAEPQRTFWTERSVPPGFRSFQSGCLLVDAEDVPLTVKRLDEVERLCRPWHHLLEPSDFMQEELALVATYVEGIEPEALFWQDSTPVMLDATAEDASDSTRWNAPTIDDLNEDMGREFARTGVEETTAEDRARLELGTEGSRHVAQSDGERLRELEDLSDVGRGCSRRAGVGRALWDVGV